MGKYTESGVLTLDTNVLNATTATLETSIGSSKTMYVVPGAGEHTTHQVQIEGSPDGGTTWYLMWTAITGKGVLMDKACQCPEIRARVVVAEGSASTCDIYIFSST